VSAADASESVLLVCGTGSCNTFVHCVCPVPGAR
jgi:hypothetical protein